MNRSDDPCTDTSLLYNIASTSPPPSKRRLIVLVPISDLDYLGLAHRIRESASRLDFRVVLFGLCPETADEPWLRRQLVIMEAIIRNGNVQAEIQVVVQERVWIRTLEAIWRSGDLIACCVGPNKGSKQQIMDQVLRSPLNMQVQVMTGFNNHTSSRSSRISQVLAWAGSIGIIIGFFFIQVRISQLSNDWFESSIFILSLIVELGVILMWNSITR